MTEGKTIIVESRGFSDIVDITGEVEKAVGESGIFNGLVAITVIGSTASISTMEYEPALIEDMKEFINSLVPETVRSRHSETWGDDNGFSHMRATLMGPGITLPVCDGAVMLGTWQQVVLIDHDNRPRSREIRIQVTGD
ncbi:MAG TPA: secondary thiamine-phosphate synthase enzyme YjbQ [Candidatus Sabulitectum sp.]|nr:secondary thiamine-phosphate synthase enzyme YjbQ [Candidatus Sabulitectum sp.]HPF31737.1 secondary thiamine-phosphate synthase enzyme YjbQ [Candidatus Sabulitectum sp.]HPJ29322.1 secondary thiamine-phosphate synthase enzyme YjbQ [Candidatus Sabulitectum sp.]HPR22518.1 secondary thiamine-phosphate synthase enzyme YjbQ [Candidatus Sabulitectum sp.]HRW77218.1 secondary thiamine-phosphate synthase enzyme YjbQ [Candidatus Sabulitectum sp.]